MQSNSKRRNDPFETSFSTKKLKRPVARQTKLNLKFKSSAVESVATRETKIKRKINVLQCCKFGLKYVHNNYHVYGRR